MFYLNIFLFVVSKTFKFLMEETLKNLCKKNEFKKILSCLKCGVVNQGFWKGSHKITQEETNNVKTFVDSKIMTYLHNETNVPNDLVMIVLWFGTEFSNKCKRDTTSFLVSKYLHEFVKELDLDFGHLNDLEGIMSLIDKRLQFFMTKYYSLPKEWNIHVEYYCKMLLETKKRLTKWFFEHNICEKVFSNNFIKVIAFEKRYSAFLKGNKCCFLDEDAKNTKCIHYKMLSTVFLPEILHFFNFNFKNILHKQNSYKTTDQYIFSNLLDFFVKVHYVLEKILHFDDSTVLKGFLKAVDFYLNELLSNVKIGTNIKEIIVVLNSIYYANQTCRDLESFINSKYDIEYILKIYENIRKLESLQIIEFDNILKKTFVNIESKGGNAVKFIEWYFKNVNFNAYTHEDTKICILEHIMSYLFVKIAELKYDRTVCEKIMEDVGEIETFLMAHHKKVPHIKMMKNFLKILMFPKDNPETFVQNFLELSSSNFTFYQILKAFKTQKLSAPLFIAYKKITGKKG